MYVDNNSTFEDILHQLKDNISPLFSNPIVHHMLAERKVAPYRKLRWVQSFHLIKLSVA